MMTDLVRDHIGLQEFAGLAAGLAAAEQTDGWEKSEELNLRN